MGQSHSAAKAEHTNPGLEEGLGANWDDAMRRGDFAAAWAVNDLVLAARDVRTRDDPSLPYHLRWVWDGTAPDGRDVLVRCYHGLGDTLQFSRYLPLLANRAAGLTMEVQGELAGFLRPLLPPAVRLAPFDPAAPLPPASCTLEVMEAGHVLRCLPPPLCVPAPRRRTGALRAGICWAGGDWDRSRSVPVEQLAPLRRVPGVEWTCLQPGHGEEPFGPMLPPGGTVADTAALLGTLDLVVTVDTMMAHLAGTAGVPAFVLLKADPDWRWLPGGGRESPWYPSVRLFRQTVPGDWGTVLEEVACNVALAESGAWEELAPATRSGGVASVP